MVGRRLLMSVCVLALLTANAEAQRAKRAKASETRVAPTSERNLQPAVTAAESLEQFKASLPGARFYGSQFYQPESHDDEARGGMTAVYGTVLSMGNTPEESAWAHFNELRGALGTDIGNMVPAIQDSGDVAQGVMWNKASQEYKFHVLRFNQYYNGIPVFRSGAGFLVRNQNGNPLVMSGFTVKDLTGNTIATPGKRQKPTATSQMIANINAVMDAVPVERSVLDGNKFDTPTVETSEEQFVVFAGVDGEFANPELAVSFVAERGSVQTVPDYHKYLVIASAATGEILHEESLICFCSTCAPVDVDGTVQGRATQGLNALECDPEVPVALPYAEVSIGGTTVNADENGNFTIPNDGTGNVTVTSTLRGTWFEVFDQAAGGATPSISQTVTPPGPVNFLHNPTTNDDEMTANVNAYVEANVVRDFVLNYDPQFPVISNQTAFDINTQVDGSCNAFYNGSSINFFANGGGCNNTSFSDVVHHEYGHHLVNVTGNGQAQMGEGSSDVMGVLIQDDPVLGQGFSNCGTGIRNANNNIQYPCDSGANGIHACGQLISGCVWDTLNELRVSEGSTQAAIDVSAQLFLGMLVVRGQMNPGQTEIEPDITVIYVELDDDDGNIGNGSPHYNQINAGFSAHNMDAPPLDALTFEYPNGRPAAIAHNGGEAFIVRVLAGPGGAPQSGTAILNVDTGSGFQAIPMGEISPNLYQAIFPTAPCGTIVNYYVSAESTSGEVQNSPMDAPASTFNGIYATVATTTFSDPGETDVGWSVSGDATDGQWDRGVPVGGGDRGDPAEDADGSGACWLTDNVDGNTDVDGGSTILTSPIMNAIGSPSETAVVKYRRFYSNNFGADPLNDVFVVEISNNGGASWVNLETVGPTGPGVVGGWIEASFRVADFIAPTSNMRVRFNASDLNDGSVVEAGVDGLEIIMADCFEDTAPMFDKFLDGIVVAGSLDDVQDSDNANYQLVPSETSNLSKQLVQVIFTSETDIFDPSEFGLRVEANFLGGPVGEVIQVIELFNEESGLWDVIDTSMASTEDTVVEAMATGDLTQYMHPTNGEIIARVTWSSPDSTFGWSVDLDQLVWRILE